MSAERLSVVERRAVRSTYRSLRLGVVVLLVLLVTAVVAEAARTGCWLDSFSAYYWTGAHDAFVGAVCAVGVLLVVNRGTADLEDALLDLAGLLAFVVALTPTDPGTGCPGGTATEAPAALADSRTGLTALVVAGLLAWVFRTVLERRTAFSPAAAVTRAGAAVVLLLLGVLLVTAPDVLVAPAHDIAAVLLFVAVVGVVLLNAFAARAVSARWAAAYTALGVAMLLTLAVVVALHATVPGWAQAVLVLEAALLGLFAAFWVLQTIELWGVDVARPSRRPAG